MRTVPRSTYRIQLGPHLGLDDAAELSAYLSALGVGALYTSPILEPAPGSEHGYDLADPTRTSRALGGEAARRRLTARLRTAGIGLVVDVVCNHMGVDDARANPWWWDALEKGPASPFARYFDIDWEAGPVILPVLGDDGDDGKAAEGQLRLEGGTLCYHERRYPIAEGTGEGTPAEVHARQHYRLVSWRRGPSEITYRRFFNIDSLAGIRTEDPEVFEALHARTLTWVRDGEVTGLRVDHPDGLADPTGYLRRLRAQAPDVWIVVEKVVAGDEPLPQSWPVDGTTGYEALHEVCGLFVDPAGRAGLAAASPAGDGCFQEVVTASRRHVLTALFPAELTRLAALTARALPAHAEDVLREALEELVVACPVYRSYLPEHRFALDTAVARAARRRPDRRDALLLVAELLAGDPHGEPAVRFQQLTGAVMAKGVEDTALYRHSVLVSLNEVGGDPDTFGTAPDHFHARNAAREAAWPATMTTLSTHDTKRSEDVRARLAVLSEIPTAYRDRVREWAARHPFPDPALAPLAWQTLVGAWPIDAHRLGAYLLKAAREARTRTDWLRPDARFEEDLARWTQATLADTVLRTSVEDLVSRIEGPGWVNALGQKALQLAGPGVPDVYQGTEVWDDSLVDPDNRRPVDFASRAALLARLDAGEQPPVDATGAAKLLVVSRLLRLRRDRPELWTGYLPLRAEGPAAGHLVGFARGGERGLVTVATRLPVGLAREGGWRDTRLPLPGARGGWSDALTGRRTEVAAPFVRDLLQRYPVAVLVRDGGASS
ncbi:malto-oligosyltrehalose synthase [Streptomyces sp. NPDC059740]|uniref:malto-oligosyltrehalose synthase n=1 Tax=Streptomyces sp. NPDC059740 TaxID=3346926 RepID=UPI0036687270